MNDIEFLAGAATRATIRGLHGTGRVALVAGAAGRGGEALLNAVIGRGRYAHVVALAEPGAMRAAEQAGRAAMAMGVARLALAPLDALPAIDDAFVCVSRADDAGARSFYGRDAPFALVADAAVTAVARAAAQAGARRFALVRPLAAWQQVGEFPRALGHVDELALAQLPFARTLIARPVAAGARRGGGLLQRVVAAYLSLQMLMLPRSIPTLTADEVARAVLVALDESDDSLTVLGAAQLAERARLRPRAATAAP